MRALLRGLGTLGLAVAFVAATPACGPGEPPLRLRHEPKRRLTYTIEQHEEAPHPVAGLGGSLDLAAKLTLSCLSADPDGSGHYEVAIRSVKITAPPAAGADVDTALGKPLPGDKDRIGATAVASSLLPRTALLVLRPTGVASGVVSDAETREHLRQFIATKPVSSRMVLVRLSDTLDPGPLTGRWWNSVASLLPANERTAPGATWPAAFPPVETPAGTLVPKVEVSYAREGDIAVLTGRGAFTLKDAPKADRMLDFDKGTMTMTARIDLVRGVVVSYDESGSFEFRLRGAGKLPAPWATTRKLRLTDEEKAQ